jgi:hypothetical protein
MSFIDEKTKNFLRFLFNDSIRVGAAILVFLPTFSLLKYVLGPVIGAGDLMISILEWGDKFITVVLVFYFWRELLLGAWEISP